jgi:hypothetical protein
MQQSFERLFVELLQNTLPSVHLYVDQIAREKRRATGTRWRWITSQTECTYERPFNEDDVQWVADKIHDLHPAGCPPIIVNKKHGFKLPDYRFDKAGSPTFEVKGPVRLTFFDPARFGHNWTKPPDAKGGSIRRDVRKILTNHCRDFPCVPHYLVLLLPCSIETLPRTFDTIMTTIAAENPGIEPYNWCFEQVRIPARTGNGLVEQVPLTIAMSVIAGSSIARPSVR